jgi:intracellular multiplication protein IcmL
MAGLLGVFKTNGDAEARYDSERNSALLRFGVIGLQSIAILFLSWLAFVRFPQTEFLWTSNGQAVCKAQKQDISQVHHATLAQFAQEAAVELNSYDFLNYRRSLTATTEKFLTPKARDQYFSALSETGLIETIKKNFFVVHSFVTDPPQLRDKGVKAGVSFWNIEVPITIWYVAGQQRIPENRVLTMTVVNADPSPQNPTGIAIDNIVSAQRIAK